MRESTAAVLIEGGDTRLGVAAARVAADPELPTFKKLMNEILGALDNPSLRLAELSRLVMRDYSLSLKLTRTANSAAYNRSGQPIRDLDHVIMLLGNRVVRELASTIIYLNTYKRKAGGLQELLLLSLLTAHVARELASITRCAAPESSFLAGMFHDLGQVLVAAHFSPEYLEIRTRTPHPEEPVPAIVRDVLGFDFTDLGRTIGAEWGLPVEVVSSMGYEPGAPLPRDRRVVRFAHELTVAAFAASPSRESRALKLAQLRHFKELGLSSTDIAPVLTTAVSETSTIFADAGMRVDDLRLLSQAEVAGAFAWEDLDR